MKRDNCIVFLTPGFPASEADSTCIPALQAFALQMKSGHPELNIKIIAFQYPFKKGWYRWNGIEVCAAGGKNRKSFFRFFTWLRVLLRLISVHRKEKIILIHSFWLTECAFTGQIFSALYRIKHIANIMGRDVLRSNSYLKFLNKKKMMVIANSDFSGKKYFEAAGKNADHIITFGLDKEKFMNDNISERTIDILGAGSLTVLKNYSLFIEIISDLKNNFPGIKAQISGKGPEMQKLDSLIHQLGLEKNVFLSGELSRDEVSRIMHRSKILLHTSLYESAGYVFLEALYCGLNVIAFQTGFQPVSDKMHICKTREEMTKKIIALLENVQDYRRLEIKTMKETADEFYEIYKQEIF